MCIEGATGSNARNINGVFEPTTEMCDGLTVFRKKGNSDVWLEFNRSVMDWFVRPTSSRGTSKGWAYVKVDSVCLPHESPAGRWQIWLGDKFELQPNVSIACLSPVPESIAQVMETLQQVELAEVSNTLHRP